MRNKHKKQKRRQSPRPIVSTVLEPLLTTAEVARQLRCSASLINKLRTHGRGPRFVYIERRVRYRPSDIATYIEEQLRDSTAADAPPPVRGRKGLHMSGA
jgi:predicted DNA-binding transcriptional regulator AlpA